MFELFFLIAGLCVQNGYKGVCEVHLKLFFFFYFMHSSFVTLFFWILGDVPAVVGRGRGYTLESFLVYHPTSVYGHNYIAMTFLNLGH